MPAGGYCSRRGIGCVVAEPPSLQGLASVLRSRGSTAASVLCQLPERLQPLSFSQHKVIDFVDCPFLSAPMPAGGKAGFFRTSDAVFTGW